MKKNKEMKFGIPFNFPVLENTFKEKETRFLQNTISLTHIYYKC